MFYSFTDWASALFTALFHIKSKLHRSICTAITTLQKATANEYFDLYRSSLKNKYLHATTKHSNATEKRQSPINLKEVDTLFAKQLKNSKLQLNYDSSCFRKIINTGYTFHVSSGDINLDQPLSCLSTNKPSGLVLLLSLYYYVMCASQYIKVIMTIVSSN